jgi:hypothetical protein
VRYSKSLFLIATLALAAACGGRVETAKVTAGGAPGAGGSVSGGSESNASSGAPSAGAPAGGAPQGCSSADDCNNGLAPQCSPCADGTTVCSTVECWAGNCVTATPVCPPPQGSCNPEFCPDVNSGVGCCLTANGPCGADFGNGCVEGNACPYGGCAVPPGQEAPRWFKPCYAVPPPCEKMMPPSCDTAFGQSAGAPCGQVGDVCTLGTCAERLVCAERDPCLTI